MKKNTLKRSMMLSFLLVALILMTIVFSYYFIAQRNALRQKVQSNGERDLEHTMRQIEVQTSQVSEFVSWAIHNDDILLLLSREKGKANVYDTQYHSVIAQMTDQLSYRPISQYLRSLFLIGENGLDIRCGSEASLASDETIAQFRNASYDSSHWGNVTKNVIPFTLSGNVIPYCYTIQDGNGDVLGELILIFSEEVLLDCYDGLLLDASNAVQLYNANGALLCGTQEHNATGEIHLDLRSSINGWKIELSIWDEALTQQINTLFTTVLLFTCLLFPIVLVISWMLTRMLVAPIERIIDRVHRISNGQFETVARRVEKTEIDCLENSILDMQDNILLLMERERQREQDKQQLELRILQEQMNPHFLYHTLNTIKLMATMQGKRSIATMTEMLIKLLRANLSIQESTISVEQELDFLESYLYIQNISKKGLLQWDCTRVSDELLSQYMPKLLLQPLAENAILHGFSSHSGIGTITVSGARYGNEMILRMQDNGCGIDAQRLEQIQYALRTANAGAAKETAHSHGIALINIQKRIQLHYGKSYGLTIASQAGHGCCVTVHLPFEEKGRESTCHPVL